jgi:uncharacterized protein YlaI
MYKVGKPILKAQKCPVCDKWLEARHLVEVDEKTFGEKIGFCKDSDNINFWFCNECKSRFEAIKVGGTNGK